MLEVGSARLFLPSAAALLLLPDARPVDHDSKRQRREEREEGREEGRGRVARRLHTPQRSQHSRSFKRAGPRVVGETYQGECPPSCSSLTLPPGIAQPEPPANPITGMGSESHLLEEDHSPSFKVMEKENNFSSMLVWVAFLRSKIHFIFIFQSFLIQTSQNLACSWNSTSLIF